MIGTVVRAGAVVLGTALLAESVEAQRVRFGVSVRLSDDVVASVGYGHRHPVYVSVYDDDYRYRRVKRHRKVHRKLDHQHDEFHHDLAHEHDELHYELTHYDPVTARRVHRQWHRDAGYAHDDFHHDLDHKHQRAHKKPHRGGTHKHRH